MSPSSLRLQFRKQAVALPADPRAAAALTAASSALKTGDRDVSLRALDRAWRAAPDSRWALGPLYAEQLLASGNPAAAAAALRVALSADPRPDTADLLSRTLRALGRPAEPPPDLGIDGRATETAGLITGWVRNGAAPDIMLTVQLRDDQGHEVRVGCSPHPTGRSRQGFRLRVKGSGLRGSRLRLAVVLPDGSEHALPDSPLLLTASVGRAPRGRSVAAIRPPAPARRAVDVVIPAYRNLRETAACIESVLASERPLGDIIVVDDCSPEPALSAWLRRLARKRKITLIRNAVNLGFPASVNRGIQLHPDRDALILNSDTLVHGNWLARLKAAAHASPDVGSVTPFTNDGSIASIPRYQASQLTADEAKALDRIASSVNHGVRGELPVGVGFCQYFTRECLIAAGDFDAAAFGAGYGEEVDLCMRARARGFRHILAADVFVLHKGGGSFGQRRDALLERNHRILDIRHPRFRSIVARHDHTDPLLAARRRIAEALLVEGKRPRSLIITLGLPGGVGRFIEDREKELRARKLEPLVIRPVYKEEQLVLLGLGCGNDLRYDPRRDRATLVALLRQLDIRHVEIHHFLGIPGWLVEAVRDLGPYDVYIHDYVWTCPQVTLIDWTGRYCGEPTVDVCERCIKRKPPNLPERIGVAALRRRSAKWLRGARRVIAPSGDVARRLAGHFPDLHLAIEPWERVTLPAPRFVAPGSRVRVALLGAIGIHKGYDVVLACARDARARNLPLEFSVIGYTHDDGPLWRTDRVFITGEYHPSELSALLRRENPHVIFLPSVWPETWSYTLSSALETGLPTVAFDLGTIAERLRGLHRGLLLPLTTAPSDLNDHLLRLAMSPSR